MMENPLMIAAGIRKETGARTVLPARAPLDSRTLKVTATAKTVPCSRILLHSSENQRTSLHNSFKSERNESAW